MTGCILAFNGERLDHVSETCHLGNGYRAYSPVLMRFTSPDSWSPFGAGGINSYAYCAGDPVNRADPSGHMSWQAGLGIGLSILGILGAVFTGGASIAAASSISAALAGASTVSLVVGTAALVADVTGIASAATEESNPKASAALGWTSLAFGILSLGAALIGRTLGQGTKTLAAASRNVDGYASGQLTAWDRVATRGLGRGKLLGGMSRTNSALEKFAQGHPDDFRLVLNQLSGRELDQFRATSTTIHNAVESNLRDIRSILPERSFGGIDVVAINTAALTRVEDINPLYLLKVREIALGIQPYTAPSQLFRAGINPLSDELMLTYTIDAYEAVVPIEGALGHRGLDTSELWIEADHADNLFRAAWLNLFR